MTRQSPGASMLAIVRALPGPNATPMPLSDLAARTGLTPGSCQVYISRIRQQLGFTVIDHQHNRGYRLGEWPGREVPCRRYQRRPITPSRPEFDSSAGVIVTEAGRRLGL